MTNVKIVTSTAREKTQGRIEAEEQARRLRDRLQTGIETRGLLTFFELSKNAVDEQDITHAQRQCVHAGLLIGRELWRCRRCLLTRSNRARNELNTQLPGEFDEFSFDFFEHGQQVDASGAAGGNCTQFRILLRLLCVTFRHFQSGLRRQPIGEIDDANERVRTDQALNRVVVIKHAVGEQRIERPFLDQPGADFGMRQAEHRLLVLAQGFVVVVFDEERRVGIRVGSEHR